MEGGKNAMINSRTNFYQLPQPGNKPGGLDLRVQLKMPSNTGNLDIGDAGGFDEDSDIRDPSDVSDPGPLSKKKNGSDPSSDMLNMILQLGMLLLMMLANRSKNEDGSGSGDDGAGGANGGGSPGQNDGMQPQSGGSGLMAMLAQLLNQFGNNNGAGGQDSENSGGGRQGGNNAPPPYTPSAAPPPTTPAAPPPSTPSANAPGPGNVPSTQGPPPANGTPAPSTTHSIGDINVDGGGKNTITVKNTSDKEQNYALFTNPGPGQVASFGKPNGFVTLKPGESANFKVPDQHSGYVQQMNNYSEADYKAGKAPDANNFKASRAEYTFNKDGTLYFNDSNIDGYNSALKMNANGQTAGSGESILSKVEQSNPGLVSQVGNQKVVEGSQFFTDQTNIEARDALDKYLNHNNNPGDLNGNTTTYVLPNDDKAVRGTQSNALELEFGNA
jgi:hypothetical protein